MTLSSLVHGADARRKVFATIGSRVQSVSTDAEVANGDELRLETEALDTSDEQDLRRWYEPTTAETLVLSNGRCVRPGIPIGALTQSRIGEQSYAFTTELSLIILAAACGPSGSNLGSLHPVRARDQSSHRLQDPLTHAVRNDQTAEILAPMPEAFAKLAEEKPGIEGVPDIAVLADIVLSFATHFFGAT